MTACLSKGFWCCEPHPPMPLHAGERSGASACVKSRWGPMACTRLCGARQADHLAHDTRCRPCRGRARTGPAGLRPAGCAGRPEYAAAGCVTAGMAGAPERGGGSGSGSGAVRGRLPGDDREPRRSARRRRPRARRPHRVRARRGPRIDPRGGRPGRRREIAASPASLPDGESRRGRWLRLQAAACAHTVRWCLTISSLSAEIGPPATRRPLSSTRNSLATRRANGSFCSTISTLSPVSRLRRISRSPIS